MYKIICNPFNQTSSQYQVITAAQYPRTLEDILSLYTRRSLVLIDPSLPVNQSRKIVTMLKSREVEVEEIRVDLRQGKTLETLVPIWRQMVEYDPDHVVGIGGGTICELAGFAAATYKRGIPCSLFPTTIIAMVDAAISGRVGINFEGKESIIGAIHHPSLVVNFLPMLDSLPEPDLRSGMAEVVRASVTSSHQLFDLLQQWIEAPKSDQKKLLEDLIHVACAVKAEIVSGSPPHHVIPLYGHMVGRVVEHLHPEYHHGHCVSIGMAVEGNLACKLKIWNKNDYNQQLEILRKLDLPTTLPPDLTPEKLIDGLKKDKYATATHVNFIFPKKLGVPFGRSGSFFTQVPHEELPGLVCSV